MLNELALFAGGGGGLLASRWLLGHRIICYVEREPYPVEIIKARIRDGYLDDAPIWDDVGTFDGRPWRGCVDIVSAGFPCQPFSVAGKRMADNDDRNGWPDTIRIIDECRPRFAFLENVPGLLAESHGYFGAILRDLSACGYDARWRVLSAAELGAPHKRDRLWIVAYAKSKRINRIRGNHREEDSSRCESVQELDTSRGQDVADADSTRRVEQWRPVTVQTEFAAAFSGGETMADTAISRRQPQGRGLCQSEPAELRRRRPEYGYQPDGSTWWQVEPDVGRVVDELAARVDRLKAIGNGQVPIVAATAWRLLTGGDG